jgi:hypothetical protein
VTKQDCYVEFLSPHWHHDQPRVQVAAPSKEAPEKGDDSDKRRFSLTKQPRAPVDTNTFALHVAPVRFKKNLAVMMTAIVRSHRCYCARV